MSLPPSSTRGVKKTTYQALVSIAAGNLSGGDLIHYTSTEAWRVQGVSLFGKSVDVTFTHEASEVDAGIVGSTGEHRFRQATLIRVMRDVASASAPPEPETVAAGDLAVGDVVHYSASESWLLTGLDFFGKSVDTSFTYQASELDPRRVGEDGAHRFRQATNLLVTRRAGKPARA